MLNLILAYAAAADTSIAPPAPWYYYDQGEGIQWETVHMIGEDVGFRTIGNGLQSGPLTDVEVLTDLLACGQAARVVLAYTDGVLERVYSVPETPCIAAQATALQDMYLGDVALNQTRHALIILDVPAEPSCSPSC